MQKISNKKQSLKNREREKRWNIHYVQYRKTIFKYSMYHVVEQIWIEDSSNQRKYLLLFCSKWENAFVDIFLFFFIRFIFIKNENVEQSNSVCFNQTLVLSNEWWKKIVSLFVPHISYFRIWIWTIFKLCFDENAKLNEKTAYL